MTDKEMIAEMAREIHYDYWGTCAKDSCSDCPHNVHNICKDKIIAEKLYNKLFPEGSVVLSKEEYVKLKYTWITDSDAYKKGSKETAREILKWLVDTGMINIAPDTTKMYFKEQFGVEVEE